jgi:cytochrome P450
VSTTETGATTAGACPVAPTGVDTARDDAVRADAVRADAVRADAVDLPRERGCPFDPPTDYRRLAAAGPVHPLRMPRGGTGWLVTEHALGRSVLTDRRFSHRRDLLHSPLPPPFPLPPDAPATAPPPEPGAFGMMDPPDHTRYRRLVAAWFSDRRAQETEPAIATVAALQLAELRAQGEPADLVRHFARPLPARVIFDQVGVPEEVRAPLQDNLDTILRLEMTLDEMIDAVTVVGEILDELAATALAGRGLPGMLADFAAGGELDATELRNVAWALLGGGTDTSGNMIALGTVALLEHPGQLDLLRGRPELIDNAVEELLRYLTISQFGASRTALEDLELAGQRVSAGQTVVVALPSANRDPGRFDDPDRLDLERNPGGHLAFGWGVHKCIGQYLARVTLRVAFRTLLAEMPALRLAVPAADLRMRHDTDHYGVHEVPVAWSPPSPEGS